MTGFSVNAIAAVFSVALFVFSSVFAYRVYKFNQRAKTWLSTYVAFIAMAFFAFLNFSPEMGILGGVNYFLIRSLSAILMFIASALFAWGFISMSKSFEEFNILGRAVKQKFEAFSNKVGAGKFKAAANKFRGRK